MSDTITTWRDITGLTDEQTDRLSKGGAVMTEADLLETARDFVARNQLQAAMADVPAPAWALRTGAWYDDGANINRTVYGTENVFQTVTVRMVGEQDSSGASPAWIEVCENAGGECYALDAGQARELAAALVQAADELDRLDGTAPPFV